MDQKKISELIVFWKAQRTKYKENTKQWHRCNKAIEDFEKKLQPTVDIEPTNDHIIEQETETVVEPEYTKREFNQPEGFDAQWQRVINVFSTEGKWETVGSLVKKIGLRPDKAQEIILWLQDENWLDIHIPKPKKPKKNDKPIAPLPPTYRKKKL